MRRVPVSPQRPLPQLRRAATALDEDSFRSSWPVESDRDTAARNNAAAGLKSSVMEAFIPYVPRTRPCRAGRD